MFVCFYKQGAHLDFERLYNDCATFWDVRASREAADVRTRPPEIQISLACDTNRSGYDFLRFWVPFWDPDSHVFKEQYNFVRSFFFINFKGFCGRGRRWQLGPSRLQNLQRLGQGFITPVPPKRGAANLCRFCSLDGPTCHRRPLQKNISKSKEKHVRQKNRTFLQKHTKPDRKRMPKIPKNRFWHCF